MHLLWINIPSWLVPPTIHLFFPLIIPPAACNFQRNNLSGYLFSFTLLSIFQPWENYFLFENILKNNCSIFIDFLLVYWFKKMFLKSGENTYLYLNWIIKRAGILLWDEWTSWCSVTKYIHLMQGTRLQNSWNAL